MQDMGAYVKSGRPLKSGPWLGRLVYFPSFKGGRCLGGIFSTSSQEAPLHVLWVPGFGPLLTGQISRQIDSEVFRG